MQRYLVKSKLGIGRDFSVYDDENGTHKVFFIDAKMGLGTKAQIMNAKGEIVYVAKGGVINIPRRMHFSAPDGKSVAELKSHISPIKKRLTMELADGQKWELTGDLLGKHYEVTQGTAKIIVMDQKWLTVRDKYFVEIDAKTDIALALGLIWAVDAWRENKN